MEITELMQRYGLSSRQSLYARLKSLGLVLEKGDKNKVCATSEQIQLLDELDKHLKNGGSLKSFLPTTKTVAVSDIPEKMSSDNLVASEGEISVLESLMGALAANIRPRSPLWYHKELEKAAAGGWLLTVREIKELVGVKPRCVKGSNVFVRGCWRFVKAGKVGGAVGWRVEKV
jgi:hypothetical protein